jgi:pantothenate kinase
MKSPAPTLHPDVIQHLHALSERPRTLLGIVGLPGAGKSTLAALAASAVSTCAQAVPMDGFHLAQAELDRQGTADRKGAPHTFDSSGYASLLRRLKQQPAGEVVYAPDFRRDLEEPVAGALPVYAETRLIISEGNYLLLSSAGWAPVAPLFDEIWYLHVDDAARLQQLLERHMRFGRTREQALAWIASNDEPNARVIETTRSRANKEVRWDAKACQYAFVSR